MSRLRHYDHLYTVRFVTFSCHHRKQLLCDPETITVFLDELDRLRREYQVRLYGYVVMPEHVHLVLLPPDGVRLGPLIGELKSRSAGRIISERIVKLAEDCLITKDGVTRFAFWMSRCYDHNCRSASAVIEKINYCHKNPVLRGLVSRPDQWRWSSFNWYAAATDVPIEMDVLGSCGSVSDDNAM